MHTDVTSHKSILSICAQCA